MAGNGVNVGHGNISISPTLANGFHSLLQQQLNAVRPQPTITVGVNVDQRGLQGLNRQLGQTQGSAHSLRNAFVGVFAALSARQAYDAYNTLGGISNRITAMTAAATSAASAVGPLIGLVGGLGAGLAVAGAGVGAFAALAKPQISAVTTATTAVTTAQDQYNAAIASGDKAGAATALQNRQKALAGLTPAQRAATTSTLQLKSAFKEQSDALAPVTLGVYTQGLGIVTRLLPALTPIARAAGNALSGIFTQAQAGIGKALSPSGGLGQFFAVVKDQIDPVLNGLSVIVTDVGRTLSHVFVAAAPLIQPVLDMLAHLTGALSNASAGSGLKNFFLSLKPLIVPLQDALQSVAGALGAFIKAAVPLAGPVLGAVKALGDALKQLFNSGQFQAFVNNIGNAVTSLAPLFSALVGPIGNVLATISGQISQLAPLVVPVITQFAQVFGQVLVGLSPLLPAFVQLAGILVSFLPILYPLIAAFRQALQPILLAIGQVLIAIRPSIDAIVRAFVALLPPIGQIIAALAPLIGQLINAFAPVLVAILQAIQPLIPIIGQVATQIAGAFVQALVILLPALVPLIPPLGQLVSALLQLFLAAIQPLLPLLPLLAHLIASLVPVLIPLVNAFTWFVNLIRPIAPLLLGLVSPFFLIVGVITLLVRIWTWAWNTVIFPLLRLAFPLFTWLWRVAIKPALDGIGAAFGFLAGIFSWEWNNIVKPVLTAFWTVARVLATILLALVFTPIKLAWQGLSFAFKFWWDFILRPVFSAIAFVAGWLWNNILKPVFQAIAFGWGLLVKGIKWVWDNILHPVFSAVASVIGRVKDAFGNAVDGIKGIWNSLKRIFAEPINAVIYPIIRNLAHGVDAVTDFALGKRPLQGLEDLKDVHFARGGVVPGNHNRDDVPIYATPGEVVVPKPVVGAMGGPDALMSALGFGPRYGGAGAHFESGGGVGGLFHDLTHNPLTDAAGKVVGKVGSAAKTVGGFVFNAADWALEKGLGFVRSGAADALDAAYRAFSGPLYGLLGTGQVPQLLRGTTDKIESTIVEAIRGREAAPDAGGDAGHWSGGRLVWPLPGHYAISQQFGHDGHPGIDIPAPLHTPIVAANSGAVVSSGPATGFGNWIRILGEGVGTVYGHMQSGDLFVHAGQNVTRGQRIAGVGSEGYSTGAHLHFEVHPGGFNAGPVNPVPYLRGNVPADGGPAGETGIVQAVHAAAAARGWGGQLGALDYIISHESSWSPTAKNPRSTAYGLFQLLYGAGNGVNEQIRNGFAYIAGRYGDPNRAQAFWQRNGYYDQGGWLMPGATMAFNGTGKPEAVFTSEQFDAIAGGLSGGGGPAVVIENFTPTERTDVDLFARQLRSTVTAGTL